MTSSLPILVFSHLRWDWVYQRRQHLLGRLAAGRRVLFVEEPVPVRDGERQHWETTQPAPGVTVYRPRTSVTAPGFCDAQLPELGALLGERLRAEGLQAGRYIAWFYTPMAVPLLAGLAPLVTVYDCMDELSSFDHAPPELRGREQELFRRADLVFTGGPSLYEAKRTQHPNVHCFPSSVDAAHFGRARAAGPEPEDQVALPRPRLGFFGVIDERLDLPLLDALAGRHPEWQVLLVGPVTKIDPGRLPRHANLHYLGQRPYAALPEYLRGWDVCLLPFARNHATRFISPTKTLEYMAAEKPIVSTPIRDVARSYSEIVRLGETPEAFVAACEAALAQSAEEHGRRVAGMRAVLARTSWDATAAAMNGLIEQAGQVREPSPNSLPAVAVGGRGSGAEHHPLVVIGAGPTGLSAAYHAPDALLLERNATPGGWCRSIEVDGFTFDYAGHIMFSNDPYVHELYGRLLGDNVHWQDREAWIYSKNVYTRYPFQGALYGLPPDVIRECIVGAIEARFGLLTSPPVAAGAAREPDSEPGGNGGHCKLGDVKDCCADGVLESTARLVGGRALPGGNGHRHAAAEPAGGVAGRENGDEPKFANFEEFIYRVWGAGIARHFAIPYNRKLWAVPLTEMETSWLGGRVPLPDLEEMIEGALRPVPKPMGPNARFGYPLRGGFQALVNGFLPHIGGRLRLETPVVAVSPRHRTVRTADGNTIRYERLISTMPLPQLVQSMGEEAPSHVRRAAAGLRHVSVRCVHLGVGRENLTDKHWIYYPEDSVFHRIFVQGNASPHCNPPGGFGLTCEITHSPCKPLPCDGDALVQRCIDDCRRVGIIGPDDPILAAAQVDMPYAYVVYDHGRSRNVQCIRHWLEMQGIILAGRYSEWEYYNSDHAFLAGKKAIEQARAVRPAAAVVHV